MAGSKSNMKAMNSELAMLQATTETHLFHHHRNSLLEGKKNKQNQAQEVGPYIII